jgi:hypothetical protein
MTKPKPVFRLAIVFGLFWPSSSFAVDGVGWGTIQGLFPGPKPEKWCLSPRDIAPWTERAAQQDSLTDIRRGDEKAWKLRGQRATVVVLQMPFAVGCKYGPPGFIVGVLDADGRLIARSTELFSAGTDVDITEKAYRIDTAPYRISDGETAFGVRIAHYRLEKHWCYADQVLHLFRVADKDVVRILTTDTFYEQFDQIELAKQDTEEALNQIEDDPDCSYKDKVFPPKGRVAVFRLLASQSKGFYDIQRTRKGAPAATFRWDGQRYLMDGKDPVDHHVREEWDSCTGRRYLDYHGLPAPMPAKVDRAEAKPAAPAGHGAGKR